MHSPSGLYMITFDYVAETNVIQLFCRVEEALLYGSVFLATVKQEQNMNKTCKKFLIMI